MSSKPKPTPPKPAAPTPAPGQQQQISEQQVKEACAAALEVLNGAQPSKILELMERLMIAKMVIGALSRGEVALAAPRPAPAAANRKERRAAKHAKL